jgi:transcriptional regulator with XRE-family HTH domain
VDGVRIGRSIRALRLRRAWRQEDLAQAAKVSRGVVAHIEQGRGDRVTVQTFEKVVSALGARLIWRIDWQGEALDRLLDHAHAEMVEWVVRTLQAYGWLCATEVSFNVYGERGSIDVFGFDPHAGALLVVEVKATIGDAQDTQMSLDRKTRLATRIAAERGWTARTVSKLLVVRAGSTARRRIAGFEATFSNAFPDRSVDVRRWLKKPGSRRISGIWFVSVDTQRTIRRASRTHRARPVQANVPGDRVSTA